MKSLLCTEERGEKETKTDPSPSLSAAQKESSNRIGKRGTTDLSSLLSIERFSLAEEEEVLPAVPAAPAEAVMNESMGKKRSIRSVSKSVHQ